MMLPLLMMVGMAQQDPLAPLVVPVPPVVQVQAPAPLPYAPTIPLIVPIDWRAEFAAIRKGDWAGAAAGIAALPDGPLKAVAKAELYTAKGSPTVSGDELQALIGEAPEMAQAEQLERLAASRGSIQMMATPERPVVSLSSATRRGRARAVVGDTVADQLRVGLDPLLKLDLADAAEALMFQSAPMMTPEGRAEAGQRVAWSYYSLGRDADAVRVAEAGRAGASGDWAVASAWVSGLASWRQNDCAAAGLRFREVAGGARESELVAAANYWAARSAQACRQPMAVAPLLREAARSTESFYGLVARETLGMATSMSAFAQADAEIVAMLPNVRRAEALVGIGERALAEEALRHQSRIGRPSDQRALIAVARRLDLAGAQYWLATNGQPGTAVEAAARYPRPRWIPQNGWRIDPALAFGHVIQESNFRDRAVSAAGAVGLMQVRPGTAGDTARARATLFDPVSLTEPTINLDYGQAFIEVLRQQPATRGQLPRVIAAYNAGPMPVDRWGAINDRGDPLLWIESIPYWETRYYVPAVMRNMWVYQGLAGDKQPSLVALAEHKWPAFPTR
jgi:soluble lytic murein transglycosylase